MYEVNQPDEAYLSQVTTLLGLQGLLLILAGAQRDL